MRLLSPNRHSISYNFFLVNYITSCFFCTHKFSSTCAKSCLVYLRKHKKWVAKLWQPQKWKAAQTHIACAFSVPLPERSSIAALFLLPHSQIETAANLSVFSSFRNAETSKVLHIIFYMYTISYSLKIRNRNLPILCFFRATTTYRHLSRQCIYSCQDNNDEFSEKPLNRK